MLSLSIEDGISCTCAANQTKKPFKYELATHAVKVRRTGALSDVKAIWDLAGKWILYINDSVYNANCNGLLKLLLLIIVLTS